MGRGAFAGAQSALTHSFGSQYVPPFVALALTPAAAWRSARRWSQSMRRDDAVRCIRIAYATGRDEREHQQLLRCCAFAVRELLLLPDTVAISERAQHDDTSGMYVVVESKAQGVSEFTGGDAALALALASPFAALLHISPLMSVCARLLCRSVLLGRIFAKLAAVCLRVATLAQRCASTADRQRGDAGVLARVQHTREWLAVGADRSCGDRPPRLLAGAALCLLAATVWGHGAPRGAPFVGAARSIVSVAHFGQNWRPFGPERQFDDGWFVLSASMSSGSVFDAWRDDIARGDAVWWLGLREWPRSDAPRRHSGARGKPALASRQFGSSMRWRNAWRAYRRSENTAAREPLAQFLCRVWNAHVDETSEIGGDESDSSAVTSDFVQRAQPLVDPARDKMLSVKIVFVRQAALPGTHVLTNEPQILWSHQCD